jgi:hypothetical protein
MAWRRRTTKGWQRFVANLSLWTIPADGGSRPRSFVSCGIVIVIIGMGAMPLEVAGWTGYLPMH